MNTTASSILSRNNVRTLGRPERPAIVLLHGMGCNQIMWHSLLPALTSHYYVVLLDLVGCGESRRQDYASLGRHHDLQGHATDLLEVFYALGLRQVVFVGHSISAMIGVMAAVREPDLFSRLVLLSPSPRFLNGRDYTGGYERADIEALLMALEADQAGWSAGFAPMVVGESARPDLVLAFSNSFASTNAGVMRHFARVALLSDSRDQLPRLEIPTLIVQAARDLLAPLSVGYYLHEQLPDSQIAVIDTSGHCPHLTAPAQTLAAMSRFLGLPLELPPVLLTVAPGGPASTTAAAAPLPRPARPAGQRPGSPLRAVG